MPVKKMKPVKKVKVTEVDALLEIATAINRLAAAAEAAAETFVGEREIEDDHGLTRSDVVEKITDQGALHPGVDRP